MPGQPPFEFAAKSYEYNYSSWTATYRYSKAAGKPVRISTQVDSTSGYRGLAGVVWVHSLHGNELILPMRHVGVSDLFHMSDLAWPWHDESFCPSPSANLVPVWIIVKRGYGQQQGLLSIVKSNPS